MSKGLELPINIIIVIAIAVLVLVAIFAFFGTQFFSTTSSVDVQKVFAQGCNTLRAAYECDYTKVNIVEVSDASLGWACTRNGYGDTVQCAKACGCSTGDAIGEALSAASTTITGTNQLDSINSGDQTAQNSETTFEIVNVDIFGEANV